MSESAHPTARTRTAVAGGVFIICVLLLSVAGASAVGSFLHGTPLRGSMAVYFGIGIALAALPQLIVPWSPIHRASFVVAVAAGFVGSSAVVFVLKKIPAPFSAREVVVLVAGVPLAVALAVYCRRRSRGHVPA